MHSLSSRHLRVGALKQARRIAAKKETDRRDAMSESSTAPPLLDAFYHAVKHSPRSTAVTTPTSCLAYRSSLP
jgi:hypothetical protein